jgi:hypothetical protein
MKNCTACEAYRDNKVSLLCPDHQQEKYLNNKKKIIDRLYKKADNNIFSFHNQLKLKMFLDWAIDTLKSLKYKYE